jgi:hypothetical protein
MIVCPQEDCLLSFQSYSSNGTIGLASRKWEISWAIPARLTLATVSEIFVRDERLCPRLTHA